MLIDYDSEINNTYTAEEVALLKSYERELEELKEEFKATYLEEAKKFIGDYEKGASVLLEGWKLDFDEKATAIHTKQRELREQVKRRYVEEKKPEGILEDVKRIVNAYELEDFKAYAQRLRDLMSLERFNVHITTAGTSPEELRAILEEHSKENFKNCFEHLYTFTHIHIAVEELLKGNDQRRALGIINDRIAQWFEQPKSGIMSYKGELFTLTEEEETSESPKAPNVLVRLPDHYRQNLTKASLRIFDSKIALEELKQREIDITPNKKGITTTYSVNVDLTAPELKGTENITEFDQSIHDIAISVALSNEYRFFTARQLAKLLLYGNDKKTSRPSPQQIGAITKSIEKQSLVRLTIDYTEHIRLNNKGKLPEGDSYSITNYMLPIKKYTATINGKEVNGYQFIDNPPLYEYAVQVGQIGEHPVKMLSVPINLDEQKIVIRDFLLREIAHMKNEHNNWNNTISVDRLLEVAGEDPKTIDRIKKSRLLDAVEKMLKYWKEEELITGYKWNRAETSGKPIKSLTIYTK